MDSHRNQNHPWNVLLIGGSSGAGKTIVARELAKRLSISLLLLDDVRLALQQATTAQTHPDLHVFLQYQTEQWRNSESIMADWIKVGSVMAEPLHAIIHHHLIVPDVGPIIIEGDGILPAAGTPFLESEDVVTVFLVEEEERRLLQNLRSRGRGFLEWDVPAQESFAHASWLYGRWLAREAENMGFPVIHVTPRHTLLERVLSIAGVPR